MSQETDQSGISSGQPDWFAAELAAAQIPLLTYIRTLLAGGEGPWDVLQNANTVMCKKSSELASRSDFRPWAYTVVRYEVLTYRKRIARDRHVFSQDVLQKLADRAELQGNDFGDRVSALKHCLGQLTDRQRQYLDLRYRSGSSLGDIARSFQRSESSVAAVLYRVRLALAQCIEAHLAKGDAR